MLFTRSVRRRASSKLSEAASDRSSGMRPPGDKRDVGSSGPRMISTTRRYWDLSEKGLRWAEGPPWHAAYRMAIGFFQIPLFSWWGGGDGSDWRFFPFFIFTLLTLRIVPAIVRHVLPFSEDLQAHWFRHRLLAKRFDSFQWRKLLWFGLGLAAYLTLVGSTDVVHTVLAVSCLLAGGLGVLKWCRVSRTVQVRAVLSMRR